MTAVQRVSAAVETAINNHVGPGEPICVALSGGMDSVVLLDASANIRGDVSAIHVHHGLSPNADVWAAFCTQLCQSRRVPLAVHRVTVEVRGKGVEAAAREARYAAFASVSARWILQAHHADDAAETLMLRLNRGTGLRGLIGIPEMRELDENHVLLRPLLSLPRSTLREYSQAKGLSWIEDESNEDTRMDRNYLRKLVVPALDTRFPAWQQNWLRAGVHAGEAQALLDDLAALDVGVAPSRLSLATLRGLSSARLRNALRYFFAEQQIDPPETDHLADIERRLRICGDDMSLGIVMGDSALMHYRGELFCIAARKAQDPAAFSRPCKLGESMGIPELGGTLHFDAVAGGGIRNAHVGLPTLVACGRREGETMKLDAKRPTRTLKNLFQEQGVPPWERPWLPRLVSGETLVWVAGLGVSSDWRAGSDEPGWAPRWVPDPD